MQGPSHDKNHVAHVAMNDRHGWLACCGWGENRDHKSFDKGEADGHFKEIESLGQGSIGLVQEIKVKGGALSIVRKRVHLRWGRQGKRMREIVENEADVLRRLEHVHIVLFVGTYQDVSAKGAIRFSLLMAPVGEADLAEFLFGVDAQDSATQSKHRAWLKNWFTCLSSALDYIYSQGIRHEDIKPSNIIHSRDHIFFTDFSSSTRFEFGETTSTANPAQNSAMYAAPEARSDLLGENPLQRHSSRSDIFSLGCVFAEMLTVIAGRSVEELHHFCESALGMRGSFPYCLALGALDTWFADDTIHDDFRKVYKRVVKPMLSSDRKGRPRADDLLRILHGEEMLAALPCTCVHGVSSLQRSDIDSSHPTSYWLNTSSLGGRTESQPINPLPPYRSNSGSAGSEDRWAQIRKNAAERAARMTADDGDSDSSGAETIESRVARIKARVAELTGNIDPSASDITGTKR